MDASKPILPQLKGRFYKLQIVVSLKDFFLSGWVAFSLSLSLPSLSPLPPPPVFSQVILHTSLKLLLNRRLPCLLSLLYSYLNKQKGGSYSPHWRKDWFSNFAFELRHISAGMLELGREQNLLLPHPKLF